MGFERGCPVAVASCPVDLALHRDLDRNGENGTCRPVCLQIDSYVYDNGKLHIYIYIYVPLSLYIQIHITYLHM